MQKPLRCDHKWGIVTFQYRIGAYWNLFSAIKNQHKNWATMMAASSSPSIRNLNWIDDDTRAPFYRSMAWDRYTVGRFSTAIVVGTHFNVEFGASANLRIQLVSSSASIYHRWTMPMALILSLILHTYLKSPRVPSFATKILPVLSNLVRYMICTTIFGIKTIHTSVSQTCQPNHPSNLDRLWKWQ